VRQIKANRITKASRVFRNAGKWRKQLAYISPCEVLQDVTAENMGALSAQFDDGDVAIEALVFVRYSNRVIKPCFKRGKT
jgi:hypothetical protein